MTLRQILPGFHCFIFFTSAGGSKIFVPILDSPSTILRNKNLTLLNNLDKPFMGALFM